MQDNILELEKSAMERWRQGDPWGFTEISADDVLYVDVGQTAPIIGIDALRAYYRQFEGVMVYQRSEFINPQVVRVGDAALLTYNYRSAVLSEGGDILQETPWNATEVYARLQGEWKITHTHWSYIHQQLPAEVVVPVPVQNPPKPYEGLLGELMALEMGAMARWRQGDPWGFTEISAPDVTYFDTGTPQRIDGLEALCEEYKPREGKTCHDVMDFVDPHVQDLGDLAVLYYRDLTTWLEPDGSVARRIPWNCTEVFRRTGDTWHIIHTHWSFIKGERVEGR